MTMDRALREAWCGFVDATAAHRPLLHNYCRRLAGNLWDAEDLVQDTLIRGFAHWGIAHPPIRDARAYLLRIATHLWIDTQRRRSAERRALGVAGGETATAPIEPVSIRAAGAQLLHRLSPQERAAVVLKEAFDMSIADIAALLAASEGAVKAALHRGRDRLAAPEPAHRPRPSPELLDAFIARFEARDAAGLAALMLDGATAENLGNSFHLGADAADGLPRFFHAVVHGHEDWPAETRYDSMRLERREIEDDLVLLAFVARKGREALMSVFRIEESAGRIARLVSYGFCPDTIRAVGETLGVKVFTGLYRAPEV